MRFKVDGVEHEFDEEKLTFGEGRALEKVTGHAFGELGEHGKELTTIQAWVWIALKREEPTLKFSDLDDRAIGDFDFGDEDEDQDETPTGGGEQQSTAVPSTSNGSSASAISLATAPSVPGSLTA